MRLISISNTVCTVTVVLSQNTKSKRLCAGVWLPSDLILESDKTRILLQNNCLVSLAKRQAAENKLDSYNLEFYMHTPLRGDRLRAKIGNPILIPGSYRANVTK